MAKASVPVANAPTKAHCCDVAHQLPGGDFRLAQLADDLESTVERRASTRPAGVEDESVDVRHAGREHLKQRHQDPIATEGPTAPIASVDCDRRLLTGQPM
jgi:hypothetical protein